MAKQFGQITFGENRVLLAAIVIALFTAFAIAGFAIQPLKAFRGFLVIPLFLSPAFFFMLVKECKNTRWSWKMILAGILLLMALLSGIIGFHEILSSTPFFEGH